MDSSESTGSRNDAAIWGIHGGALGEADQLFLSESVVALGWERMGDLTKLAPNREAFKVEFQRAYPEAKTGSIPTMAGQPFRFLHEMRIGDVVAYPSKKDREVHLGTISGDYAYAGPSVDYPHRRTVNWKTSVPRTHFSQAALYEMGSAMSLFQIKNNADEVLDALSGLAATKPVVDDSTVADVSEDYAVTTEDFLLKRLAKDAKGHEFEACVAALLKAMGYYTRGVPPGPDGGVDIVATRDELGALQPLVKVQVKSTEGKVGDPEVSALYGKVHPGEFGLVVALGQFTPQAKGFASGRSNLRLIDGQELVQLLLAHYEELDPTWKARLPLKQVWLPDPGE